MLPMWISPDGEMPVEITGGRLVSGCEGDRQGREGQRVIHPGDETVRVAIIDRHRHGLACVRRGHAADLYPGQGRQAGLGGVGRADRGMATVAVGRRAAL